MAAVIAFPQSVPASTEHGGSVRPELVLIEGGRGPAGRSRRRRILTRRVGALVRGVVVGWAVVMLSVGVGRALVGADASRPDSLPDRHVVVPGETMWGIASQLDLDLDVRVVVDELSRANGGSTIRPGQVLRIPAALAAG